MTKPMIIRQNRNRYLAAAALFSGIALLGACAPMPVVQTTTEQTTTRQIVPTTMPSVTTTTTKIQQTTP